MEASATLLVPPLVRDRLGVTAAAQALWSGPRRNFACVCRPQRSKLLVSLKADPKEADMAEDLVKDVQDLYHHARCFA
ncbi:hypothetical protein [Streptomyces sp. NPDC058665]|uniref:hypothetical protein n=1 Tax=Streptomyces sp. NPDC058665 TaxID=3346586 RepID=UPI00366343E3